METSGEEASQAMPIEAQPDVPEKQISPIKIKVAQRKSQV
jgi:hypothetical protein